MRKKRLRWAILFSVGGARKSGAAAGLLLAAGHVGAEQALVAVVGEAVVAAGRG